MFYVYSTKFEPEVVDSDNPREVKNALLGLNQTLANFRSKVENCKILMQEDEQSVSHYGALITSYEQEIGKIKALIEKFENNMSQEKE